MKPPTHHLTAALMPTNYTVRLKWSDDLTITTLSSWRFGLAQFWAQTPGYFTQYMTIYKMSRILQVRVQVTAINTTASTPAEICLAVLPLSDYSRTLAEAKRLPKSKFKYLSGAGGLDRASVTYVAALNDWVGVDSRSIRDYQQSASEANSTLGLLPDTPIIAAYVGGASVEPTLRVFLDVWYDIEFFEPEQPGSITASEERKPLDMTEKARPELESFMMTDEKVQKVEQPPPRAPVRGRK